MKHLGQSSIRTAKAAHKSPSRPPELRELDEDKAEKELRITRYTCLSWIKKYSFLIAFCVLSVVTVYMVLPSHHGPVAPGARAATALHPKVGTLAHRRTSPPTIESYALHESSDDGDDGFAGFGGPSEPDGGDDEAVDDGGAPPSEDEGEGEEGEEQEEDQDEAASSSETRVSGNEDSANGDDVEEAAGSSSGEDDDGASSTQSDEADEADEEGLGAPRKKEWKHVGGVWRKVFKDGDIDAGVDRPEIGWFERRSVQDKLEFQRYINCPKRGLPVPSLDGLKTKSLDVNDFVVHQGNFVRLGKGPDVNRTDRIRHVELLPPDGESVLLNRRWGSCAIVGNSGHLHFSEYAKAIDSHDQVIRVNQAPTFRYHRRVGRRVTHRILNRLWTRTYRNANGKKHGTVLPAEKDLTFIVTRASSQEFELLQEYFAQRRPDIKLLYLSSRATSMAQPLLKGYREKLCHAGYGPYKGFHVPSSGYTIIFVLMNLCERLSVYGFGVKGIEGGPSSYPYHYYKGVGARKVGDDVHCFDAEEMLLKQLGREEKIEFCMYEDPERSKDGARHNWGCGCQHDDVEECRPDELPRSIKDTDDCLEDDCETRAEREKRRARGARGL